MKVKQKTYLYFFQTCARLNIYKRIWEIYVAFDYTPDWLPYVYAKSTGWEDGGRDARSDMRGHTNIKGADTEWPFCY